MAEAGYGRTARVRGSLKWSEVALPVVEHEDRMSAEDSEEVWNKIYRLFRANSEDMRNEVKLAVYAYYAVNGASPQTPHTRKVRTGGGIEVLSADVLDAIGSNELIRKFLRSDVDEAYSALKESGVLSSDEVFSAKIIDKGVPRQFAYCAVDYLKGCSMFTPVEKDYADKAFQYSIQRAKASRGGKSVEDISKEGRNSRLKAQDSSVLPDDEF